MRDGELALAIEASPGLAGDIARPRAVPPGAWVDGAMPERAETVRCDVQSMRGMARRLGHPLARHPPYTGQHAGKPSQGDWTDGVNPEGQPGDAR